jgi:hypothetical protein
LSTFVDRTPLLGAVSLLGELERFDGRGDSTVTLVDTIATLQRASGAVVDLELALYLADHGRPDLELARAAHVERPSVYGADALAWTLHRLGRDADALPYAEEATRLGTADALVRYHAAAILAGAGQPDRARAFLGEALATNPFFSFGLREEAAALAGQLGVAVPAAWSAGG